MESSKASFINIGQQGININNKGETFTANALVSFLGDSSYLYLEAAAFSSGSGLSVAVRPLKAPM